ncbi:hypothetical protein GOBAR_DD01597 [Gossypium barbadense]|nr:hypothetical protein GOBAR_DD01597 [Gossypium barbadense]
MDEGQSSMIEAQLANLTAIVSKLMTGATYNEGWRDHPNLRYQNRATLPGFDQQNSRQYNSSQQQPNHQNLSAETKTHTMLEQMMKMMVDQKKETDRRFQSLESVVKQLQTRASSTDVNLGNLQAQVNNRLPSQPMANPRDNVSAITLRSGKELRSILKKFQNSDEENDTEVKKVRFSDIEEENLALPKVDLQPSQTAPKEVGKSRLQQSTALHDAANSDQEMRVPELRAQASQNANNQLRSYVPKAPFPQREEDKLKSVLAKSIFDIDKQEFIISDSLINLVCALDSPKLTRFKPILLNLTVTGKQVP